ncbi:phosphodiester glycosidase family protein [Glycomyces tenuis]|uniref:phosphodiester glycosidase family protein n=3 Tax=Glycomyces tenuis TaxID=58116 RepID=UPI000420B164|nr:phosphodiester glycosidase family protein [Glycomyces tenuis]
MRTAPWILATATLLTTALIAPSAAAQDAATDAIQVDGDTRTLAPGVELESFDRWEDQGWLRADAVTVDLTADVRPEYLSPGSVSDASTVREQTEGHEDVVLAVNADFFDINDTGGPQGAAIEGGELVKSADTGTSHAVAFDADGRGSIRSIGFTGTATTASGTLDLHGLNTTAIPADGIGAYTPAWGADSRARVAEGAAELLEVTIVDGIVTAVDDTPDEGAIPEGAIALVGREAGASALAALAVGDTVQVEYAPVVDGAVPDLAVSGRQVLIEDGETVPHEDQSRHPRTAVGFSEDGRTMYLVTFDGRQAASGGYTLDEVAAELRAMGAHSALNLDGGGSSTMLARSSGTDELITVNSPSDGNEREVGNGLALTVPAGDGEAAGFAVEPLAPFAPGSIDPHDYGRVFPGLSRPLSATPYDASFAPAEATPYWRTGSIRSGHVDGDAVFHAGHRSGTVTVTAASGRASGSTEMTVLGPLAEIEPSQRLLSLPDGDATAAFQLIGSDADGFTAPVDPADIELEYDPDVIAVEADGRGGFTVSAATDSGSTVVDLTVDGHSTTLAVTIGLTEQPVADFSDAEQWTFTAARATGSVAPADGHDGDGLAMAYDFTQSTATRAAYAWPPASIEVDGQPQRFGMWIKAQGNGEWPSLHLKDAEGTDVVLRGDHLTWEGWRWVEFEVPQGTQYPLSVYRLYVAETAPDASYNGEIAISGLVSYVAPDVELPDPETRPDPLIADDLDGADWTFAVMSDAQFVAEDPDSPIVESARRTLREIKDSGADLLIVNGDLVDECESEDLALAEQVLDEELGDAMDWVYVPGNHEVMGCDIEDWSATFGPAYQTFDHGGTRFVTLDTSRLTIAGGGFEQITMLREALDGAAEDPDIHSVAVVAHVPPHDSSPQQASQLGDRLEAAVLERWLGEFETGTGKESVYIGAHAGYFAADHIDGVAYWVNGNSGKAPHGSAEDGGFIGWTEFGVNEEADRSWPWAPEEQWLAAQVRPQVDELALDSPTSVSPGETVQIGAELTQGDAVLPVGYPMSVEWSGSDELCIGSKPPGPLQWWLCDAWFDPDTNELLAWRHGTVELTVSVNGVEASRTISVE